MPKLTPEESKESRHAKLIKIKTLTDNAIVKLEREKGYKHQVKIQAIKTAFDLLSLAVFAKDDMEGVPTTYKAYPEHSYRTAHPADKDFCNPEQIKEFKFSSLDEMLGYTVQQYSEGVDGTFMAGEYQDGIDAGFYDKSSVRYALNMARYNPFNFFGESYGPLWGKTNCLKEIEEAITTEDAKEAVVLNSSSVMQ